jgi:uncharacterized membrane protein YccC
MRPHQRILGLILGLIIGMAIITGIIASMGTGKSTSMTMGTRIIL